MPNALARKYRLDVTADLTLTSGFVQVKGINDFNDNITPNVEDASAYDTNGWMAREITMQDAEVDATFLRRQLAQVYDVGQELIRSRRGQFDTASRLGARWYDVNGGPEAYAGVFILGGWTRNATGAKNLEQVQTKLQLTDVPLSFIANPIAGTGAPVVIAANPASGANTGKQLFLQGSNFTGTTGITVGGTAVGTGNFGVVSDGLIGLIMPSGSAGSVPIVVTNAVGPSAAFAYTRGA